MEDERVSRRALSALLDRSGYHTTAVASGEEALALLRLGPLPRIALIDLDLPGMSGDELIKRLAELDEGVVPIILSAADPDRISTVVNDRRIVFLRKPVNFDHLLSVLSETRTLQ